MNNPINPLSRASTGSINNNSPKTQANNPASSPTVASPAASSETVSLSQGSQQVSSLQQQLKDSPVIDSAKVEAIKQEIANGNYPLDPVKIAENLISLEQSLLE